MTPPARTARQRKHDALNRLDPLTVQREREYAYLASDALPQTLAAYGLALA